jgi:hypothetical protein
VHRARAARADARRSAGDPKLPTTPS